MENIKENKMGSAPVFKLIMSMSIPAMFSMLIQALYNIVDSMFVAKIGEGALAAVSLAFPIQMVLISVAVGTGVGINSLVARLLGEGKKKEASVAASQGITLAIISWIVFAIIGIFFTKAFFKGMKVDDAVFQMGCQYTYIVTIFSFGSFLQINFEKALQATGNMIYPMVFQLIGAITNIILDPIFIFGYFGVPKMGVAGAAIATVIGQTFAMFASVYVIVKKEHEIHINMKNAKPNLKIIKRIYIVGLPAIVMQSIGSVLVTVLNLILIAFSQAAVAVFGVYFKLQSFIFMPVFGLTQGVMPIMGYNYGAKNKERMLKTFKIGIALAVGIMAVGMIIFLVFPRQLMMLFNASQEMQQIGVDALRTISLSFIPAAFGVMCSTMFQALGDGVKSLIISVLRQLVLIIPAAYLLSKIGLHYVWFSFPIAELFAFFASAIMLKLVYNKKIKNL